MSTITNTTTTQFQQAIDLLAQAIQSGKIVNLKFKDCSRTVIPCCVGFAKDQAANLLCMTLRPVPGGEMQEDVRVYKVAHLSDIEITDEQSTTAYPWRTYIHRHFAPDGIVARLQ